MQNLIPTLIFWIHVCSLSLINNRCRHWHVFLEPRDFHENQKLQISEREDQWFEVQFPGQRDNYIIAVIYRHPWDNANVF